MDIGSELGRIPVANLALMAETLLLFGIVFNALVGWLARRRYLEGYLSFVAAAGVLMVLGILAFISLPAAILSLMAFTCAGLPLMLGSIWRYIRSRELDQNETRKAGRE